MTALTRGRLPARVYWRRRAVLVLAVLALVVGVVRLAGALTGPDGSPPAAQPERAAPAAARTSEDATAEDEAVTSPDTPSEQRTDPEVEDGGREDATGQGRKEAESALAEPEGVCSDRDVAVTPSVPEPVGGGPVVIELELRTISTPACTWTVSPTTLTVKLTSGSDDIWSSQDCPASVPKEDVVVRSAQGTTVEVTWSGRRSDDECSRQTEWALPGWYYVDASALAGEPSDLHFELVRPDRPVEKKMKSRDRDVRPGREERGERRADREEEPSGREGRRDRQGGGRDRG